MGNFGELLNSKPFFRAKKYCYSCRSINGFGGLYRIRMVLLVSVTFIHSQSISYPQFNGQGRLICTTSRALKQWTSADSVNWRSNGVKSFPVGKVLLGIFLQVHWQQTVCTHRLTTYLCILPHLSWKRLLVLRMIIHIISNLRKIALTHSITVHSSWNQAQR